MAAGGRKRGLTIILIAILIFIIVIAAGAFMFLRGSLLNFTASTVELGTPIPQQNLIQIIIVAQNIKRGTIIDETMLGTVAYPQNEMVGNLFYTDMKNVLGKTAKYDLQQGAPLTPALLSDVAVGSLISSQIPEGKVAISIPVDSLTSVSYVLQPGDHVNIIASFSIVDLDANFQSILPNLTGSIISPAVTELGQELVAKAIVPTVPAQQGRAELDLTLNQPIYVLPSESQRPRIVSQSLVQDAVVIWVGNFPFDKCPGDALDQCGAAVVPTPVPGTQPEDAAPAPTPEPPNKIALAVSPQDAVAINYLLESNGKLTLVLRSASEVPGGSTEAVTLQYLMDQYSIPYPAKLPYGIQNGQIPPKPVPTSAPE